MIASSSNLIELIAKTGCGSAMLQDYTLWREGGSLHFLKFSWSSVDKQLASLHVCFSPVLCHYSSLNCILSHVCSYLTALSDHMQSY